MKKRITFFAVIFLLSLLLSGCFDIYQNITRDSNGFDRNIIKVTLNKTMIDMGNSFGESGAIDYNDIFKDDDPELNEYKRFGAYVSKINSELDIGYLIEMSLNYRDSAVTNAINQSKDSFIHKYNGKNMTIHIDFANKSGSSGDDGGMATAVMSSGKYRLVVSKKCVANIRRVTLKTNEGESDVSFFDVVDGYLIEIPIPILFASAIDIYIHSA